MITSESCKYHLCNARDLKSEDWVTWQQILDSRSDLDSPFFHHGLTRSVARLRDDIEVVVLSDAGETVGYFPFQRCPGNMAQAVTGRLSEFHGVISKPGIHFCPEDLLRSAGLRAWQFDHLPTSQHQFQKFIWGEFASPFMDLSSGYDAYRESIKKRGSSLSQVERKSRKMAREVGPIRFEFQSTDEEAFRSLIQWKSEQHQRTKALQILKLDWVPKLLNHLRQTQYDGFQGQFSTLYVGDELIAVHLGLRSDSALHIWFPAYNTKYEKYSPGLILLLEMARQSACENLKRIDMGRGEERYKTNFKTGDLPIAEGAIDTKPFSAQLRHGWFKTKRWIRESPYRKQIEVPLNACRKLRQWKTFK